MIKKRIRIVIIFTIIITILTNCSEDNSINSNLNKDVINLEDAKLSVFPLLGITPVSINIKQPTILDGKETVFGEIDIVVPSSVSLNEIASFITSDELNLSKFAIIPGNNSKLNYETESHLHTIVNVLDESEELLHYTVNIEKEVIETPPTLTVIDFKFEASKNAQLSNDVTIERSFENGVNRKNIYLFVPAGTDFSNLIPTATFDAEEVFYTQSTSISSVDVNTPYPSAETSFDFAYPKSFIIVLRDDTNNKIKSVNVFVDVKNPVEIVNTDIITPDVVTPNSSSFRNVTTWKNVGNHRLRFKSPVTYENKEPSSTIDFITVRRSFPSLGLEPKESANIHVGVIRDLPLGEYKVTAALHTGFTGNNAIDDLIEPAKLNIVTKVIN